MQRRSLAVLVMLLFLGSMSVFAQQFTGRITDTSGAVIPRASITVHNEKSNVDIKTVTTETGDFTVPYLKPGVYSVSAMASGFKTAIRSGITLEVGQTSTVNLILTVGAKSDSVTVQAEAAQLDFAKADRGEVVENTRVTELPLNGRDPNMLSTLNAGAVWTGNISWQRPFDDTQQNLSINGAPSGNNALLLDGVTNEAARGNSSIAYVPPVDAVQEFKIVTNPYDAQYGRAAGGAVDMTLKSGTNAFHGDVYEFLRRTWLDANTWQNNYLNATKHTNEYTRSNHKLDQYGFELDGPVVLPKLYNGRNKSFFVTQYENWSEKTPNSLITSVPDPKWLTGDFSNLTYWNDVHGKYEPIVIYDPLTLHKDATGKLVRDPFPGNIIPQNRLNPVALKMLSYYPAPNMTPPDKSNPFENNYSTPNPTTNTYRNVLGKWDQYISDRNRVFIRYGYWEREEKRSYNGMAGAAAEGQLPHGERSHSFGTDWVHTFSPNLLFDFRGTVLVRYDYTSDGPAGFDDTTLGWNGAWLSKLSRVGTNHFPKVEISEFATIGNSGSESYTANSLAMMPSVTWIKGKHNIHFGMDLRLLQQATDSKQQGPYFWVDRQWTQSNYIGSEWTRDSGNSIASMLLGTMTSGDASINPLAYWTQHYYAPWLQDDWKVTPKLTLNLGIRWDFNGPQYERHNRSAYAFDMASLNPIDSLVDHSLLPGGRKLLGGIRYMGVNGNPRSLYPLVKTNIQPRVGFAYGLNEKTVLRGGFGEMFINPLPGGNQVGYSSDTQYIASLDNGQTPLQNLSTPYSTIVQPTGNTLGMLTQLGQGPWFINPDYKTPSFWSYSLGVQRELSPRDTLEIGYVGSRTYNWDSSRNINMVSADYYKRCNVEMGGDHRICDDNGNVPNPFYGIAAFAGSGYDQAQTIWAGNLTRPYPEFGDITEWQMNSKRTWYNSLQVTGVHKAKSLTLHGTWTWSKNMGAGWWKDQRYGIRARSIDSDDRTHRITISGVYKLPFGRGQKLLPNINRFVDAVVGGWQMGDSFIYETGKPWAVPSDLEYVGNAHIDRVKTSNGYIRGVAPCIAYTDPDTGAHTFTDYAQKYGCTTANFIQRPGYAAKENVVYTGIRIPSNYQFDANLAKNFPIREAMHLQFRLEAFNVLNHPLWQSDYDGSYRSTYFGTIQRGPWEQSNLPRQVQLALKLMW